ncbi:MAG: 1-deoxy-D-xylulose-5-phosphate reductoisomerase [Bacteroidetes bacterium]|nr:1-deoxy-D-xylulose-5-phosphate reductoisomerase [Bacteroidota bacterium]
MQTGSSTPAFSEAPKEPLQPRRIAVFGSTGSIGTQTLDVIRDNPNLFVASILTAHSNAKLLIEQAILHRPHTVVIVEEQGYADVREALQPLGIAVLSGAAALEEAAGHPGYDLMLAAIVGFAGLKPTLQAITTRRPIALANKETLVVAGDIVMQRAVEGRVPIIPVDSEHSAIFQCLVGETYNRIEKIILTASGGPFFGKKPNFLVNVRKEHALQHPNWNMGAKITIDSATLMNKGLEMIEARWLFNLEPSRIQVVIHPQSIIHSMVQFEDGSIKAQMGLPDMKLPIQYALAYPQRIPNRFPRFDFKRSSTLNFEPPDIRTFQNLALASEAMFKGGNAPAVLNAANEIAVFGFLRNRLGFLDMTDMIERTMAHVPYIEQPTLDDYFESDGEARNFAASLMNM